MLDNYDGSEPINIGNTGEVSIKEIANIIIGHFGYQGEVIWDTSMPTGQYRKPSSNQRLMDLTDYKYKGFEKSLISTCDWFAKKYPYVRGID